MAVRIRFRTDSWHYADLKSWGWTPEKMTKTWGEEAANVEVPRPGDVWRIRWAADNGDGPVAGYAICCPKCGHVHAWTTASNCSQKKTVDFTDKDGTVHHIVTCVHSGVSSCWNWSGSAEEGTLSAHPSLQVLDARCGFHGWLTNGELSSC